jgi:flagellar protein FlgJ
MGDSGIDRLAPDRVTTGETDAARAEKIKKDQRLKKACADFESLFIYYMMKNMRSTVPKSGLVQPMQGKETYETIMDQKVSENLADQGGVGLQKTLYNQLKRGL